MIFEHTNYREFIHSSLVEKISKNPSYSLRAMAKQLDVSPSTLSEVMKSKRSLSVERASFIATKLGLKDKESEYFCLLVQMENIKDPSIKESIQKRLEALNPGVKVRNLSVDLFKMISDWYHLPILHLSELTNFDFRPPNIAPRLGISTFEAEAAIERLERLELLTRDEKGRYSKTTDFLSEAVVPNEALRRYHKEMLEKTIETLQAQTPKEKITRTETIAIDPSLLPKADELMEEFIAKITKLFAKSGKKTDVYHLGVHFFNLTKKGKKL